MEPGNPPECPSEENCTREHTKISWKTQRPTYSMRSELNIKDRGRDLNRWQCSSGPRKMTSCHKSLVLGFQSTRVTMTLQWRRPGIIVCPKPLHTYLYLIPHVCIEEERERETYLYNVIFTNKTIKVEV